MVCPAFLFSIEVYLLWASQVVLAVKNPPANAGNIRALGSIPGSGRSPGGVHGNLLQCSCLENPHGQRSLAGYTPRGHKESDTTEQQAQEPIGSRVWVLSLNLPKPPILISGKAWPLSCLAPREVIWQASSQVPRKKLLQRQNSLRACQHPDLSTEGPDDLPDVAPLTE